jgi:hypothetical protein
MVTFAWVVTGSGATKDKQWKEKKNSLIIRNFFGHPTNRSIIREAQSSIRVGYRKLIEQ